MVLTRNDRAKLLLKGLREAPTPDSVDASIALLHSVVNAVEDAHSGIPFDPEMPNGDRMYGPHSDNIQHYSYYSRVVTRGNRIHIWKDGGFVVLNTHGAVVAYNLHSQQDA